jgi:hypothetical protein
LTGATIKALIKIQEVDDISDSEESAADNEGRGGKDQTTPGGPG